MTISRENFRRIMGLNNEEFEPYTAKNRPPQLGGYEAVYFGGWNDSNTSRRNTGSDDKPITDKCLPNDWNCLLKIEQGTEIPEIEIYDCETGEKTRIITNINKKITPTPCTSPPTAEHKCFRIAEQGCSPCYPRVVNYEFLTEAEAMSKFPSLMKDYTPCNGRVCSKIKEWTDNGWKSLGSGYTGIRRQESYRCYDDKGSACNTAYAVIEQCAGQISCNCRQEKNIQNTELGFQYTCYDKQFELVAFPCISGCVALADEKVEVEVCSTAYGISVRRKDNGKWILGTDQYGRKL